MEKIKLLIPYYSKSGTNYQMALWAKEAAEAAGAEVRMRKAPELAPKSVIDSVPEWKAFVEKTSYVPDITLDDMVWAEAYLFSVPTRYGMIASQMKQFIDTVGGIWSQGKLANKVASAMTSANNMHGGQEATLLSLYTIFYHWGSFVVTPGYTDPAVADAGGNPYGTSATANGEFPDELQAAVKYQAQRVVTVAEWLKKGREA